MVEASRNMRRAWRDMGGNRKVPVRNAATLNTSLCSFRLMVLRPSSPAQRAFGLCFCFFEIFPRINVSRNATIFH